uniref:Secreted protein n=1 Tax=Strongyloides venezuelensis TaxID=75913 RepID=A0A0K0G5X2_STRVS
MYIYIASYVSSQEVRKSITVIRYPLLLLLLVKELTGAVYRYKSNNNLCSGFLTYVCLVSYKELTTLCKKVS